MKSDSEFVFWQKPLVKIFTAYLFFVMLLVLALAVKIAWYGNNPLTAFSVIPALAVSILWGPIHGLLNTANIIAYLTVLISIFLLTVVGLYYRFTFWGRLISVAGLIAWSFFGMLSIENIL